MYVHQQVPWNSRIIHCVYLSGAGAEERSKITKREMEQEQRMSREETGEEEKGVPGRERRKENKKSTLSNPGTFQEKLYALRQKT